MAEILVCGKTELLTEEAMHKLTEDFHLVVAGQTEPYGSRKNFTVYNISVMDKKFRQLFNVHNFQTVFYISGFADGSNGMFGENQQIKEITAVCGEFQIGKLVVFSTLDQSFESRQMEAACIHYAEEERIKTVIIRLPFLAGCADREGILNEIFHKIHEKEKICFLHTKDTYIDFLSLNDFADLMYQLIEETEDKNGIYPAVSGYHNTYADLENVIRQIVPDTEITYENVRSTVELPEYPDELRKIYGFIPKDNVMKEIPVYYRNYAETENKLQGGIRKKISAAVSRFGKSTLKYAELIVLFLIAEFISRFTSESVYFKFVDVRLFYILIMGTLYGMKTGIAAAVIESVVLVREYAAAGMNGIILFYNIENWIPFVIYLMTGSITGYISEKKDGALTFAKEEYALLREKYLFLNKVYRGAVENKGQYKRQILGFKDSFGKIFDAVQKLDTELPEKVFLHGIRVLEDILENRTIAIYSLDSRQKYGRLTVCSNSLLNVLPKSVRIEDFREIYDTISEKRVWKNMDMKENLPMYACGIFRGDIPVLLVTIRDVGMDQYTMAYLNILQIICGLLQTSFLRALDYEEFMASRMYYPDTGIVYPERLQQAFDVQRAMKKDGVADFVLFRFADRDKKRISEKMTGLIRGSDMLGADLQGNIYLLLVQANRKTSEIVGERLRQKGIEYQVVEKIA